MLHELLRSAVRSVPPAPQTGPGAAEEIVPDFQATASPTTSVGDEAEITRLAALSAVAYEQERKEAAQQLHCRVSVLDKLVAEARGGVGDTLAGHALNLPEPEPWPEQVDRAALLDSIVAAICRHMVLDDGEADTLALWTVGTHVYDVFVIFPRLAITSPVRRCGKTTLLDILASLVLRPLLASGISTAGVFRTVEKAHPTLLIDKIDRFLKNSEETIGVLNAGHRRGGQVVRVVETRDGYEPRAFDCFSPAALTGIGKLPDTLDDRSVKVKLRRKRRDEKVASLRLDRMEAFEILSRKAARWADDTRARLAEADPDMPPVLFNRVADNWRPLIAVADAAGGEWPERARRVAEAAAAQDPDESARTILLADLRDLFDREPSGVLFTKEDILPVLAGMDHRPWPEWRNDKPLSAKQLAGLLKPFRVSPGTVRRGDRTDKGYRRADLEDAFARYLDEASAFQSVTPSQVANSAGFGDFQSVTHSENVTDPMAKKSRTPAGCDGVTDQDPLASEEEATWTA